MGYLVLELDQFDSRLDCGESGVVVVACRAGLCCLQRNGGVQWSEGDDGRHYGRCRRGRLCRRRRTEHKQEADEDGETGRPEGPISMRKAMQEIALNKSRVLSTFFPP